MAPVGTTTSPNNFSMGARSQQFLKNERTKPWPTSDPRHNTLVSLHHPTLPCPPLPPRGTPHERYPSPRARRAWSSLVVPRNPPSPTESRKRARRGCQCEHSVNPSRSWARITCIKFASLRQVCVALPTCAAFIILASGADVLIPFAAYAAASSAHLRRTSLAPLLHLRVLLVTRSNRRLLG